MKLPDYNETVDIVLSYLAVGLASLAKLDWMHIGAAILLIARLIHDVPPAYMYLKQKIKVYRSKLK